MAVTILEALENAEVNVNSGSSIGLMFAKSQLHNAIMLLEKGYSINDEVEPLLEKYGDVDNVPKKSIKEEK